ncbi:hypothetical protein ACHAXM_008379 [Skeletonema potamos]|jgi:hypothetical protein
MTEQMNYATYGQSRRRRVRPGAKMGQRASLSGSMQQKGEHHAVPSTATSSRINARARRRKYTQMSSRSKSPPLRSTKNRSASPPRRRPSVQENAEKQKAEPVRRPKLVKSKSWDERPRQQYQQKQNEFQRQISGFDFFEKRSIQNNKSVDDVTKAAPENNNKQNGSKFVVSAKSFFKDKMPGVPTISGNTCKKYSDFVLSRFRSDDSSICCQNDQENTGTVKTNVSADSKLSYDECSSEGSETIVEIEEVDMDEEEDDDVSERSNEIESGFGSNDERLSSLTFSQDPYKNKEALCDNDGDDFRDEHANDDQINKFTKELVILLDENESLRGNINDLRREFEAMLKQMQAIADGRECFDDERSIQTEDSRVSHCLRKIDELKIQALEKFKKVAENREDDKKEELAKKERDIASFEACIEDLLCENERLFKNVVTLSKEREIILKEVQSLRATGKQEDFASSTASIAAESGCTIPHFMLTDEKEAEAQHSKLDTISRLLKKLKISSEEDGDAPTEAEDDIISLVSKIMSQQHYRARWNESDLPVVSEDKQEQDSTNEVNLKEQSRLKEGCDEEESSEVKDDVDDDYISGADDDEFRSSSSTCSGSTDNSSDNDVPSGHGDDSSEALEVIYEYYSSASEGSGSAQFQRYSPKMRHVRQYVDYDDEDSQDSDGYFDDEDEYYREKRNSFHTTDYSFGSIESADYYFHGDRSRSKSKSASASRTRSSSSSRARSASESRSTETSVSRSRSASRTRSLCRDKGQNASRPYSSSSKRSSSSRETNKDKEDDVQSSSQSEKSAQEKEIATVIDSYLDPTVFNKSLKVRTLSTCASMSASESDVSMSTCPSFSSDSTKEQKAITITVVCRSSRHVSFPSTHKHTFMSFFTVSLRKHQVDAVLEEQLLQSKESTSSLNDSNVTCLQNNCSTKKKKSRRYKGDFNEDGQRHGYGIYTSKNGNSYRGDWRNNKREGLGVVKVGNGDIFEGQFENNLKNGVGVYHYQDGECDLSRYENDHRVGNSIRWTADRKHSFLLQPDQPSVLEIPLAKAASIAKKMGIVVAY